MTLLFATLFALTLIGAIFVTALLSSRYNTELEKRRKGQQELEKAKDELEKQVQHAINRRAKLLDALEDAFLLVEDESIIRVYNARAKSLFNNRELLDRSLSEIVLDGKLLKKLKSSLKENTRNTRTVIIRLPDDHPERAGIQQNEVVLEIDTAPYSRSQHLKRVTIRNVTQAYITEQVRKDFVANASHELRTPLAIINGYLENLLDDDILEDPKMSRKFLSTMRKHSTRISRIIEDMLVISKLESGEASRLKIKKFRIRKCVDDVIERLQQMIDETGTKIEMEMNDKSLAFEGDRFYWTQIIFNLLENAIKQNPQKNLTLKIGARQKKGMIHLWIVDDGVGIPSSHLPFIFKRFYRVETHHSKEIRGTGLGLSIVKRGVEAHGGTIEASSTPGLETRFDITVPLEQETES